MHLIILITLVLLSWALFSIRWQLCMAKRCAEARSQGTRETLVTPIKAKEVSKWVKINVFRKAWLSFYTFDEVLESWTLLRLLWGAISSVLWQVWQLIYVWLEWRLVAPGPPHRAQWGHFATTLILKGTVCKNFSSRFIRRKLHKIHLRMCAIAVQMKAVWFWFFYIYCCM